jgi:uncharacterized protein YecE (DUF72 family)
MSKAAPRRCVGCSGWNYKSWRGRFYPEELPPARWLRFYVRTFATVEANTTFYRLPARTTLEAWADQLPPGFVMAVKASRFLTHLKRLRDPEEPLARLFDRVGALGPHLGPVLYQLPGHFHADPARLTAFLERLPRRLAGAGALQHVLEFRHRSWYTDATFAILERHGVALCLHDKDGSDIAEPEVGPFVYVRFHGTTGRYHGSYDTPALEGWADRLAATWRRGRDVYAYFNNDPEAVATVNARTLAAALDARLAAPRSLVASSSTRSTR